MAEIAKEYGAALFMLALEKENTLVFYEEMQIMKSAFLENPLFSQMLSSPSISLAERISAIDAAFEGRISEEILSYLKLMTEKGRIALFLESVEEYQALFDASQNTFKATVKSAVELTEKEKEALIQKLEKSEKGTVQAEYQIDPDLIGGIVVEMNGKVLDGSIRHRLHLMKEVLNP